VAATPASVAKLRELGFEVWVEIGAGEAAGYDDDAYTAAGAELCGDVRKLWSTADVVLKVRPPGEHPTLGCHEADLLAEGAVLISFIWPAQNSALLERLAQRRATVLAMDAVPRLTRAQKLDALSSMALVAGYRAVVVAAHHFDSFFAGQMTAAGKVTPARVLVIGAGVAGLAAIAAARGLGAIVLAFDTRAEVKDQVRSLGAEFIEVELTEAETGEGGGGYARTMSEAFIAAEMELFRQHAPEVDVVITTALVPGRPAPKLWLADMVAAMKRGSVIVDLAAEQGGNCELTRPGHVAVEHGVTIVGFTDYTRPMAHTASQLYGTNLVHLLEELGGAQGFVIDLEDEVIRSALVVHRGEITWRPPSALPRAPAPAAPAQRATPAPVAPPPATALAAPARGLAPGSLLLGAAALALLVAWSWIKIGAGGSGAPSAAATELVQHGTVFVLACFVGWQLIWSVSPALHTPLMSVTNAISGIIALGGLLQSMRGDGGAAALLGAAAVLLAMINVSGGFWVTQRMLRMFRRA
jgi:NAD(P) transhydrogenase subunit alpha